MEKIEYTYLMVSQRDTAQLDRREAFTSIGANAVSGFTVNRFDVKDPSGKPQIIIAVSGTTAVFGVYVFPVA